MRGLGNARVGAAGGKYCARFAAGSTHGLPRRRSRSLEREASVGTRRVADFGAEAGVEKNRRPRAESLPLQLSRVSTFFRGGEIRAGNGALERDARVRSPAKYITGNPLGAPAVAAEVDVLPEQLHRRGARQGHLGGRLGPAQAQNGRDSRGVPVIRRRMISRA